MQQSHKKEETPTHLTSIISLVMLFPLFVVIIRPVVVLVVGILTMAVIIPVVILAVVIQLTAIITFVVILVGASQYWHDNMHTMAVITVVAILLSAIHVW
jgi:hypothetical protein